MTNPGFSVAEKQAVEKETLAHIKELIEIDSRKTASLVLKGFAARLTEIVNRLRDNEDVLYDFLQGIFETK